MAIREHVISRPSDLPLFLAQHPLHRLYGGENALLLSQYRAAIAGAGFRQLGVLTPWSSPINYAPRSLAGLQDELALRLTRPLPGLRRLVRAGLSIGALWQLLRAVLERADHRPGRLYSFVAQS